MRLMTLVGGLLLALTMHVPGAMAQADTFPEKPIKIIVPFAPGGSNDVIARALAHEMTGILGQSVVVENVPGAAGSINVMRTMTSL